MASFAANESHAEAGVVERMGTTGTENEHPSPFSPMTDASTLRDVDEESTADCEYSLRFLRRCHADETAAGVSTFQGMLRMKMEHEGKRPHLTPFPLIDTPN
jgi:hypothetical protein